MATVILKQTALAGKTLTLYLRSMSSGVVVNTGGDACSEGTTGHFAATVDETLTGLHEASFLNASGATQYGGWVNMSFNPAIVDSPDQLGFSSTSQAALDGVASAVNTLTTRIPGTVQPQSGDAYARLGAPAGASVSADILEVGTDVNTLLGRITSTLFNGITSVADWLRAIMRSDASVSGVAISEINSGSGDYDNESSSLEAIDVEVNTTTVSAFTEAALQQLMANPITITQPLGTNATIDIVRGMDYSSSLSRAIVWTDSHDEWPTLTGATITVYAWGRGGTGRQVKAFAGAVVTGTGSPKQVKLELTAAQTKGMTAGDWTYGVKAVLSGGSTVDLLKPTHKWTVREFPD